MLPTYTYLLIIIITNCFRLEDYDNLFGPVVNDPEIAYKILLPTPEHFRDIHSESEIPSLTTAELEAFCILTGRDNLMSSQNMYDEWFLISCRSAKFNQEYYVTGVCSSEMRKNVTYNVTVKAKDNLILEAQCECAAGAGPYGQCKHIVVILYGIIDFNKNKNIKLKPSCTSMLQSFHQPSTSYSGNPIQVENLTLKKKKKKMSEMIKFDPRSNVYSMEKNRENFRNLIANYCGKGNSNLPIAQTLKAANKQAMFEDHSYLEKTTEEHFLSSLILSEEELIKIEIETRDNKKKCIEQRKLRLQSSNFGKICKQKTNLINLARNFIKTSELQAPAIKHGIKYEKEAINKFQEICNKTVKKCGIIVHPVYQFLGSIPDGLVGESEVLEVKCPFSAKNKQISGDTVPYLYLCEKSGQLKLYENHDYYYQIQGQMLCAQKDAAFFFVYTLSDYCIIKVNKDNNFIEEMLKNLKSFYDNYFKQAMLERFLYNKRI